MQPCKVVHQLELNIAVVRITVLALVHGRFGSKMCTGVQAVEPAIFVHLQASDTAKSSGLPGNASEGSGLNTDTSGVTE